MMKTYIITCLSVCLSMGGYAKNKSFLFIKDHVYEMEEGSRQSPAATLSLDDLKGLTFSKEPLTGIIGSEEWFDYEPQKKDIQPVKDILSARNTQPVVVLRNFFALGVLGANIDNLATQKDVSISCPYFVDNHKTHIINALNSVGYDVKVETDKKTGLYSEDLVRDIISIKGKKLSDLKKEELYSYVYGFYTTYGCDKIIGDTCSLYWDRFYERPAAMFDLLQRASHNIAYDTSIVAVGKGEARLTRQTFFVINRGLFTFVPSQELLEYLKLAQGTSNTFCTERVVK